MIDELTTCDAIVDCAHAVIVSFAESAFMFRKVVLDIVGQTTFANEAQRAQLADP
jgi:hypothetical protein